MKSFAVVALFVACCLAASSAAPNYPAPAHHGYGHAPAPAAHHYAAKAPHAKCGAHLLIGCAPAVAKVPCVPVKHHHEGYHHAPAPAHHGYRAMDDIMGIDEE